MKRLVLLWLVIAAAWAEPNAVAVLESTPDNRAHGMVWLLPQRDERLRVVARVIGLRPDKEHALHFHQLWKSPAVDLGLLKADYRGVAILDVTLEDTRLSDLMARPIVVHQANSEISANLAVGKVEEADARAMAALSEVLASEEYAER